jgi:drug/metabolite transporter (DMT)-like permease
VATSVILVTANPLFVTIASYFFFNERLGRQTFLGIAVCIVGGVLIGYGNWRIGLDSLIGGILALSGALAVAGYLLIGRSVRKNMGLLSYAAICYSSAALLLLFITVVCGYPLFDYSARTYLMMVLLAVVPQLLGHLSFNWSLRYISATLVTIAILGEPVGATILAFIILDEVPTVLEIGGGFLLLLGIFIAFRKKKTTLWR